MVPLETQKSVQIFTNNTRLHIQSNYVERQKIIHPILILIDKLFSFKGTQFKCAMKSKRGKNNTGCCT